MSDPECITEEQRERFKRVHTPKPAPTSEPVPPAVPTPPATPMTPAQAERFRKAHPIPTPSAPRQS